MADKVTKMVVKVDLECPSCYKKIKKILAKFPEIRDQVYDVKKGTVTITVICCSPEKIREKLCCKGGKIIKGIDIIKDPPKPKEPEKKKEPEKPKEKEKEKEADKKKKEPEKPKEPEKKEPEKPKETAKPPAPTPLPPAVPVPGYPPYYPAGVCCGPCYEGYGGGPCYHGYGRPVPSYDNYGYPVRGWHSSRCDYFSEENPSACTIM